MSDDQNTLSIARADELAGEINQIKDQVRSTVVKGAVEIGKRLKEAKSLVPYGQWEKWLETNVDYSARTAQNMMRIAEEYGKQETKALAELSVTQAVLLMGVPAAQREAFLAENDVAAMSTRELEATIAELKEQLAKQQMTIDELLNDVPEAMKEESQQETEELQRRVEKLEAEAENHAANGQMLREELDRAKAKAADMAAEKAAEATKVNKLVKEKTEAVQREERAKEKAREAEEHARQMAEKLSAAEAALKKERETVRTVEVIPEAVEKELNRLRGQVSRSMAESEMRAAYDNYKTSFERLMEKLEEAAREDAETAAKFRQAFHKAVLTMAKQMEG